MVTNRSNINSFFIISEQISRRLKYLGGVLFLSWTLFFFLRISFFLIFFEAASASNILHSFWIGMRFDLRLAVLISIPGMVFCILPIGPILETITYNYHIKVGLWCTTIIGCFILCV